MVPVGVLLFAFSLGGFLMVLSFASGSLTEPVQSSHREDASRVNE